MYSINSSYSFLESLGILAHGFNHVIDAANFWEIISGWISRTFRDVECLDDSIRRCTCRNAWFFPSRLEHGPGCVNSTPKFSTMTEFGSPMNVMFVPAIPCASPHASMTRVSLVQKMITSSIPAAFNLSCPATKPGT